MHDVLKIMSMIDQARVILASHQSGQWQGEEPSLATLVNDIKQSQLDAFPEMEQVRRAYASIAEPYKAVRNYLKTGIGAFRT